MEYHAFQESGNTERNPDCVRCGKPATATEHSVAVSILPEEMAYLYNLLCTNPRVWNNRLRVILAYRVSKTEAHNAQVELVGKTAGGKV